MAAVGQGRRAGAYSRRNKGTHKPYTICCMWHGGWGLYSLDLCIQAWAGLRCWQHPR